MSSIFPLTLGCFIVGTGSLDSMVFHNVCFISVVNKLQANQLNRQLN